MSTQWTAEDNVHALGGAACTHQQEVVALELQVMRLKDLVGKLEWCAIRSSESESTGTVHRYYCCPICQGDKRWGKHVSDCSLSAALAAPPAPERSVDIHE